MPEQPKSNSTNDTTADWFVSWFDTPYYHILYKDRDYAEARQFIDTVTQYLNLEEGSKILDLACGKGRHSIYLNQLGYDVTGADLSANSIAEASKSENETLHFVRHDMRKPIGSTFDAVFNLFTSFGYFEKPEDNLSTLKAIRDSLTETGLALIDFMNVDHVIDNLVASENKVVEGIDFTIARRYEDRHIIKDIRFSDKGKDFHYTERVQALRLADFEALMEEAGIFLLDVFGDYKLHKYHKKDSERLIMIFK